jgi:hypothetical protein
MKKLVSLIILALGCGSYDDGYEVPGDETGSAEEAITVHQSTAAFNPFMGGVMSDTSPNDSTCQQLMGANSTCVHPSKKTIKIKCTEPTISPVLDAVIASANASLSASGWSLSHNNVTFDVEMSSSNVALPNTGPDDIDRYSDFSPIAVGAGLTEAVAIPGLHKVWATALIRINLSQINARGATAAEDLTILRHSVAHEVAKIVDVGARPNIVAGASTFASERLILPLNVTKVLFSPGELCRTKAYSLNPAGVTLVQDCAGL